MAKKDKVTEIVSGDETPDFIKARNEKLLEFEKKLLALKEQEVRASGEIATNAERAQAASAARKLRAEELLKIYKQTDAQLHSQIATLQKQKEDAKKLEDESKEAWEERKAAFDEEIKKRKQLLDLTQEERDLKAEALEASQAAEDALQKRIDKARALTDQWGTLVGVSDDWQKGLIGSTYMMLQAEGGLEAMALTMADTFSLMNIGASMMSKVVEASVALFKQQDDAIASFKKATGAGDAYNDVIVESYMELRTFGVSTAQAGEATQALFREMSQFSLMTKEAQKQLVKTAAILTNFGISASIATNSMEILNKALGQGTNQTETTSRGLFALADALGLTPEVIFSQFVPAAATLTAHGDNMINVFTGLAAASKTTGLEMSNLLTIAGQFDQFESGARSVGKLNALLGGPYFNSIEMLNASEEERIRLLIQGIEVSGRSFGSLGRYEQRAIAASVGITDMAEANKLFNTSLSAYDAAQAKAKAASISQEDFEEASRNAMAVQQKFTAVIENFAVSLAWMLKPLNATLDVILDLQEALGGWFGIIVFGTGSLFFFIGTLVSLYSIIWAIANLAGTGLAASIAALGQAVGVAGTAALKGAAGMLAFGAAVLLVGAGIYVAALGVAELVKAFKDFNYDQVIGVSVALLALAGTIVGITAIMAGLAASGAGPLAVGLLLAFGAAVLIMGLGVGIAAAGMSMLATSFADMFKTLNNIPIDQLTQLMVLIASAGGASGFMALAGIGLGIFALGLQALFWAIDLDKLKAFADLAKSIGTMMWGHPGAEGSAATGGPGGPGPKPSSPFGDMVSAVNSLDETKVDYAKKLAKTAGDYNKSVWKNQAPVAPPSGDSPAGAFRTASGPAGPAGTNLPPIYLVLNNQIFGRVAGESIAKANGAMKLERQ